MYPRVASSLQGSILFYGKPMHLHNASQSPVSPPAPPVLARSLLVLAGLAGATAEGPGSGVGADVAGNVPLCSYLPFLSVNVRGTFYYIYVPFISCSKYKCNELPWPQCNMTSYSPVITRMAGRVPLQSGQPYFTRQEWHL